MKKTIYAAVAAITITASAFTIALTSNWQIAKDYAVKFDDSKAKGVFETMKGTIVFDEKNPGSAKVDITIDVSSINTGNGLKNKHAKGEKWFDAEKFPTIHFVSTSVAKKANGYEVKGDLQLHGVTKPIAIPFTFQETGSNGTFKGNFKINRNIYGIGKLDEKDPDITTLDITVPVTAKK